MTSITPLFFVVAGAHGVGKTTAVVAASELLEQRGLAVHHFHHIEDTAPATRAKHIASDAPTRSRPWWRRVIPRPLKMLVSSTINELRYWRRINQILADAATNGQIALADRYAYDRVVDTRLRRRALVQRVVLRVVGTLMRRPTLTILLTDEPTAIYQRKQERSISEITEYQTDLETLCKRLGAPLAVIPVNGFDADKVARTLVDTIVETARERGYPLPSVLSESIAVAKRAS